MQFDREGVDDSKQGTTNSIDSEIGFDLGKHFLKNGLSRSAYHKIAPEIQNGDMNVNILVDCSENDLNTMANQYNFTFLQTKAFIKAVNLLKANKNVRVSDNNNNNSNNNNNNNEPQLSQFVYVSPEDQSVLNEIDRLGRILKEYEGQCMKTKETNTQQILYAILKLENSKKLLIECFNEEINKLVKIVCCNVM